MFMASMVLYGSPHNTRGVWTEIWAGALKLTDQNMEDWEIKEVLHFPVLLFQSILAISFVLCMHK